MANPQTENGHLRIANEIWEHLITSGLSASEFPVVMLVIRKTWGWKKKDAPISLSEFHSMTKLPERTVAHALRKLTGKNILIRFVGGGRGNPSKWGLNKDWETWKTVQPIAEIINSAKINSVYNCSQTVQPIAQITATHCIVSGSKLLPGMENEPPKTSFKAIKEASSQKAEKKPRPRDEASDLFCQRYQEILGAPYVTKNGDFAQLASLRKAANIGNLACPEGWGTAIDNYLYSPVIHTLAYLCVHFGDFRVSRMNEYNRMVTPPKRSQLLTDEEKQRYNTTGLT